MKTGVVKWFNEEKGYGFIAGNDGTDVFVHFSDIVADGFRTLSEGQNVQYDEQDTDRGVKAIEVKVI